MLTIKSITDKPCFLTGKRTNVVEAKFKDGSFSGAIEWNELLKVMKRREGNDEGERSSRTPAGE